MTFTEHFDAGTAAYGQGRFDESFFHFREAGKLQPDHPVLVANLAAALYELGRLDESEAHAEKAIRLNPHFNRPHITLGMLRLQKGDFARGWPEYEWVGTLNDEVKKLPETARWRGEPIAGRKIVVIDEQGFGDTLQFLRFSQTLAESGADVYLDVKPALRRLCEFNPKLGKVLHPGSPAEFGRWTRLLSIPFLTGVRTADLARHMPYLSAPVLDRDSKTDGLSGFKVGVIWKGSSANGRDAIRSIPVEDLGPLFALARENAGIRFFHLSHLSCAPQIAAAGFADCVTELHDEIKDFAGLASLIARMDCTVTVDTAVAHLSGAMGKTTFCLLSRVADWRWGVDEATSSWYPSTRLFRQPSPGLWAAPVAAAAEAIRLEFLL